MTCHSTRVSRVESRDLQSAGTLREARGESVIFLIPSPCPFPIPLPVEEEGEGSIHAVAYLHSFRTGNCVSHLSIKNRHALVLAHP
jgi:hypothetical protein